MNALHQQLKKIWPKIGKWMALVLSSIAFAISGIWVTDGWIHQIIYVSLTFVAGCFYGLAYLFTDNNILAPVLVHTVTATGMLLFFFP